MKDARGTELEEGQKVAYNFQGEVAVGRIVGFKEVEHYGYGHTRILVQRETHQNDMRTKPSVVSKPVNLVVIFES